MRAAWSARSGRVARPEATRAAATDVKRRGNAATHTVRPAETLPGRSTNQVTRSTAAKTAAPAETAQDTTGSRRGRATPSRTSAARYGLTGDLRRSSLGHSGQRFFDEIEPVLAPEKLGADHEARHAEDAARG